MPQKRADTTMTFLKQCTARHLQFVSNTAAFNLE